MRKYAKPRGYVGRGKARRHGEQHSARLPCPNMAIDALPQIFRDFDRGRRRHSEAPCRQLIDTCPFDIDRAAAVESCANHFFRRSEEHTSELQSLMRISYAVFCLKKKNTKHNHPS